MKYLKQKHCLFILFFIQTKGVLFVKGQLYFSVLSAEVKPLPPERAGPE